MAKNFYAMYADAYLAAGYNPVPVKAGEKRAANSEWNRHVPDLPSQEEIDGLKLKYGDGNIGLAVGTYLNTKRLFAAIDIDTPGFVPFCKKVIGNHVSGKVGSKGLTIFCQAETTLKSIKLRAKGKKNYGVELMVDTGMVVIPPSVHPNGNAYVWDGLPLLEVEQANLPLLTTTASAIIQHVVANASAWEIVEGGAEVQGHEPMLKLAASGIALLTDDLEWLAECLNALFPRGYAGNTKKETLEMLRSAKEKGLGQMKHEIIHYQAGEEGPVPFGYLEDGRYVFYDRGRSLLLVESSNRLTSEGALINMAQESFWRRQFPRFGSQGKVIGIDCTRAADTLMRACRVVGGFDVSRVRGRGVYVDTAGQVVVNWGDKIPADSRYIYVCHLPLQSRTEECPPVDANTVLEYFRLFCWNNASEAYLLLGWVALAVVCGVLDWRPHIFIGGPKNSGKTTLILTLMSLLDPIGIALDGQSTEAGIRQKIGPDSRPVLLDEFESDQNIGRMKSVVKLIRSASSAKYTIARGTPEGKALEFCIRSSFLLGAINPFMVTAADRSRIVVLTLKKHNNDKDVASRIAQLRESLEGVGPSWCRLIIDNVHHIRSSIKTVERVFPPCESRHALNMASLLAGAWVALHQREITTTEAEALIAEHTDIIGNLAEAHEEDDAIECLNALLGYQTKDGTIGVSLAYAKKSINPKDSEMHRIALEEYGIRWVGDGFVIANSHPGVKKIFRESLWAEGAWVTALSRVDGAEKRKQLRFSGGVRSLCTWIPAKHITDDFEKVTDFE